MTKFLIYAVALVLAASATLAISNGNVPTAGRTEARLAADGAFRDGLYLGKMAAQSGQPAHAAVGRWSSAQDREMFTAGYQRGYREAGGVNGGYNHPAE